jgi:alkanesulfonate monooxygenase SsuD/methylene tetrahydromethanopterin reductase-like flavin-dependent oxidoreductase (luciferase family)
LKFGATTVPLEPWGDLIGCWTQLEAHPQVESIWLPDHLYKGWYECWTALAGLADVTTRVRVGSLISPATAHEPKRLARAAWTVDEASNHRLELGVGTGGDSRRFQAWMDELVSLAGDIPLTVGGTGETVLRVAAKHASRWNYSPGRDDSREDARRTGRELNARLDELAERPILRSALIDYPFTAEDGTPLEELVTAWADAGFEELILGPDRFLGEG